MEQRTDIDMSMWTAARAMPSRRPHWFWHACLLQSVEIVGGSAAYEAFQYEEAGWNRSSTLARQQLHSPYARDVAEFAYGRLRAAI